MASNESEMIVVAATREQTDLINEENNQQLIEKATEKILGVRKVVTAITNDQKTLLINYFKDRTASIPVIKEEPKEHINETEQRLIKLFGKSGYKKMEG